MTDDELYDNMIAEQQKGQLSRSAIIAHNTIPDQHAENVKAAKAAGIPAAFATPAKVAPSSNALTATIDKFHALQSKSPATAAFMENTGNSMLAHDDTDNLSAWEDFFKPIIHTAASMAQMPVAGLAATAKLITSKGNLGEAAKVLEDNQRILDEAYLTSDKGREVSGFISKAMVPFQMAGRGWAGLAELPTGGIEGASKVAKGEDAGSNIMVPVMGTIGEASAMFGFGEGLKVAKARAEIIKKGLDLSKKVKTVKRDPEVAKEHFKSVTDAKVNLPVDKLDEFLAENKLSVEDVFDEPTMYYEAKFKDEPVEIPVSDLAAVADKIQPELINEMKVGDSPSVAEIEKKMEEAKANDTQSGKAAEVKQPWEMTRDEYTNQVKPEASPNEVFYINGVEIIQNPTPMDYSQLRKEVREQFPNNKDAEVRFTEDDRGNRFIWKASDAVHSQIEPGITDKIGRKVSQNPPDNSAAEHRREVYRALVDKKQVADNVLADYVGDEVIGPLIKDISTPSPTGKVQPQSEFGSRTPEATTGGDLKPRGLSKNIEGSAIDAGIIKEPGELGELPTYEVRSKPQEKIAAFVDADPAFARKVADGLEPPPDGVLRSEVFTEIRKRATIEGDAKTLMELLDSPMAEAATELGREIQALDAGMGPIDPFRDAQEVIAVRKDRAEKTGLKPEEQAKVDELSAKLTAAEEKIKAYEEAAAKKQAEKVVKAIVDENKKVARRVTRAVTKEALDTEFKALSSQLSKILNPNRTNIGIPLDAVPILLEMAKNRVKSGLVTVEGVVDSVYEEVSQFIDTSKREVRDAISGYGKTGKMSQEELAVQLRELKRQARLISALEDAQAGEAPLRSGLKRDPVSDKVRELTKQVKDAMRESGIDSKSTKSPEEQYKTSLDAVKTRLKNQIADITKQLETGEKTPKKKGITYDEEANALKAKRDKLKAELEAVEGKQPMSEEQRLQTYKTRVANEIANIEKKLETGDFEKTPRKSATLDAEGKKLKAEVERAREEIKAIREANSEIGKEEVTKLVELGKEAFDKEAVLDKKLSEAADPDAYEASYPPEMADYGAAHVVYLQYLDHIKGFDAPVKELVKRRVGEFKTTAKTNKTRAVADLGHDALKRLASISRQLVSTADISFPLRQGLKVLQTHPSAWWPGTVKSFELFVKTFGNPAAKDALLAWVYSKRNYRDGTYQRAGITTKFEEMFPDDLVTRLPVVGRAFKAPENAYTGAGLKMRVDTFDFFQRKALKNGVDITDPVWIKDIGQLVNSMTLRGKWGKRGASESVRIFMWSPNMLKGNIDVLTAHGFGKGFDHPMAKREAAINIAKIIGETAALLVLAKALAPDSVEFDFRSSDAGKIKIGDTRFDVTGGAAGIVTLAFRLVPALWGDAATKSPQSGLVTKYGTGFGDPTAWDALVNFLENKTSPPARLMVDMLQGKDFEGEPFTWSGGLDRAFTPISFQNAIKTADDPTADKVAATLVDIIGINANSYTDTGKKRRDIVTRMRKGKDLTEEQQDFYDSLTDKQEKSIDASVELTPMQEAFGNLRAEAMVYSWARLTDSERDDVRDIYETRINKYIIDHDLDGEDLDKLNEAMYQAENRR